VRALGHLFGVSLRAQPSNAAIAINPVINVGFVFQASDFPGVGARILSHNIPSSSEFRTVLNVTFAFAMTCYARFSTKWNRFAAILAAR
jgi:hypothetical protein